MAEGSGVRQLARDEKELDFLVAKIEALFEPITARGRQLMERAFPARQVDLDGDGKADYKVPRHPL